MKQPWADGGNKEHDQAPMIRVKSRPAMLRRPLVLDRVTAFYENTIN